VEIEPGMRHRAAGDALATAHCLLRLLDDARGHGCERWSELERFLSTGSATKKRRGRRAPGMPMPVDRDTTA
jgi:DNA polymerase-3 subunit epsilon